MPHHPKFPLLPLALCLLGALAACRATPEPQATTSAAPTPSPAPPVTFTTAPFGTMPDGTTVEVITLTNRAGVEVRAMTYGATILSIRTPDRNGKLGDITLGYDDLASYLEVSPYFGAVVGRYGNRIARGRFDLDRVTYALAKNDGPNHLHGGVRGFDKVVWKAEPFADTRGAGVAFSRTSPDGEEGYPGNLSAKVTYLLTEANELQIAYEVTTDKATPQNLTQHTYFNLTGVALSVLDHRLMIQASHYTPVDATLIPAGGIVPVSGTPFDFTVETTIGARILQPNAQLKRGGGYDHNWVFDREGAGLEKLVTVYEPTSGRTLEISTTEPGVQFYSGNFLDGKLVGKGGVKYEHRSGFCLETQHYPDSPNQPSFPTTILRPGDTYRSQTVWTFGVRQ